MKGDQDHDHLIHMYKFSLFLSGRVPGTHADILTSNTAARSAGQYFMRGEQRTCT